MTENETLWNWGNHQKYHADLENYIGTKITEHSSDAVSHITADERTAWNGKTTIEECAEAFSNPNLLINPDLSINQRGKVEYSGNEIYSVDMWRSFGCKVAPKENGGVDLYLADGADYFSITQLFELLLETGHYTVSFAVDDKVYSGTGYLSSEESGFGVAFEGGRCEVWKNRVQFYFDSIESASLDYVKLEPGSVATSFVRPNPATELVKCQWYFERLYIPLNKALMAYTSYVSTSECMYVISYKKKRSNPTITPSSYGRFVDALNPRTVELTSFTPFLITPDSVTVTAVCAGDLGNTTVGWVDGLEYVDISAEP